MEDFKIFKVQLSLATTESRRQCMIYNEDRSLQWQGDAGKLLVGDMKGRNKAFFYGFINKKRQIEICTKGGPLPDQGW